ncbi:hypothetical protein [Pseudoteredinibacter isoporae]|uniref:Uncharacterized protein n=1 Tax=Pseudoteredinibacter isoporae TaxID=570281 RepID=A0A7X0JS04_9GAMM|nr:hypothetical protein [Pseudoteredinibacter isoporae]MBB6521214.1 hypothetical protein [Pseudoteredinibacter isoporae]NHO86774.1 hypothetical protein [Pseudoteredinibacter isoporae]NIB24774.1 hypothetical protein [Pseudoteredinibacter isoporae]
MPKNEGTTPIKMLALRWSWLFVIIMWLPMIILVFGGLPGFLYILLILALSTKFLWELFRKGKIINGSAYVLSIALAIWVGFTPYKHPGIGGKDENGKREIHFHQHWFWEPGHIH